MLMKSIFALAFTIFSLSFYGQQPNKSIYFDSGKYNLNKAAKKDLKQFLQAAKGFEIDSIYLEGHTDSLGSIEYNYWLSEERCKIVHQELAKKFDCPIKYVFKSELDPAADNESEIGKQLNRRVTIICFIHTDEKDVTEELVQDSTQQYDGQTVFDILKSMEQKSQVVSVPNHKDTVIIGDYGTAFIIKKKSFVYPNGSRPERVVLEFNEYVTLDQMILGSMTTYCKEGMLETKGMVDIQAYDENGNKLRLIKDMQIGFETEEKDDRMTTFYGKTKRSSVNGEITTWEQDKGTSSNVNNRGLIIGSAVRLRPRDLTGGLLESWLKICMPWALHKTEKLRDNFNETRYQEWARKAEEKQKVIMENQSKEVFQDSIVSRKEANELTRQFINVNSLGKINCDAFSNVSARKKYTQKFDTKRSGQVNAFLVFMDRASLLPCYKSWSGGKKIASDPIPLDLRAKIVSFKLDNGKLYLAIEDIRTSRDVHQLNYELITEENLQQKLRVLRA